MVMKSIVLLLGLSTVSIYGVTANNPHVISVFGSSVANGAFCSGNCSGKSSVSNVGGCYQSRLRVYQQNFDGRSVFNNCHGGDTTIKLLNRFDQMLSSNASFVFIGLSLANEGIMGPNPDKIYAQYAVGMHKLINQSRDNGIEPVVGMCYPNSYYTAKHYGYIKNMNLLTNTWNVPSANFLGTIDDGLGRWVQGFNVNSGHPNDAGSTEMYYAIVPSIFDAIASGKKPLPSRADGQQFVTIKRGKSPKPLSFAPAKQDTIHSFTVQFGFRIQTDGALAAVIMSSNSNTVKVVDGKLFYTFSAGTIHSLVDVNDGKWHEIIISHYWCNQTSNLYLDGEVFGQVQERLEPVEFVLGGDNSSDQAPESADYQDWIIYRAGLNTDEINTMYSKRQLLQSSLEIYAPLDSRGDLAENRAQSLSKIQIAKSLLN